MYYSSLCLESIAAYNLEHCYRSSPCAHAPKQLLDGVTHANDVWWTGKQGIVATQYATSDDEDLGTLVLTNPGAVVSPFCASSIFYSYVSTTQ